MVVLVVVLLLVLVVVLVLMVLLLSGVDDLLSPVGIAVVILLSHQEARCRSRHKPAKTWKKSRTQDHKEKDGATPRGMKGIDINQSRAGSVALFWS